MKKICIYLILLFHTAFIAAQNFYEIEWEGIDEVDYQAFVIFYDLDDIKIRVAYSVDDNYNVAEYDAKANYLDAGNGNRHFYLDGSDAKIVYNENPNNSSGYSADNFVFTNLNENNAYQELFTIDDKGLEKSNYEDYFAEARITFLDPETDFDEEFLFQYFEKDEDLFASLLSLNKGVDTENRSVNNDEFKVHLFVVGDTNDVKVGTSIVNDIKNFKNLMNEVSEALNVDFEFDEITGNNFTYNNVLNSIENLRVSENDVIVFFYSGHGSNHASSSSQFPTMSLKHNGLGLEKAHDILKGKNARLVLTIGNLCNSVASYSRNQPAMFSTSPRLDVKKLKKLFVDAEGQLISTSSRYGQNSFALIGSTHESAFYKAFIETFLNKNSSVSYGSTSWASILDDTYDKAYFYTSRFENVDGSYGQNGFYSQNLKY